MVAVEAGGRHRAVGYRHLPRANHLIARHHAGYAAVADGDQEGFFRYGRQMEHALHRLFQRHAVARQGFVLRLLTTHIARHLRRFAQQHVQRHIDRLVIEVAVGERQVLFFRRFANHRIGGALALAKLIKQRQLVRRHRQHIALLRFVAPNFQRAHARLIVEDVAQVETPAAAAVAHQLRHGVRQAARAHIVDKQNRVLLAQLPATVDHFLTAAFHFRVVALYRSEIEIGVGLA